MMEETRAASLFNKVNSEFFRTKLHEPLVAVLEKYDFIVCSLWTGCGCDLATGCLLWWPRGRMLSQKFARSFWREALSSVGSSWRETRVQRVARCGTRWWHDDVHEAMPLTAILSSVHCISFIINTQHYHQQG